MLFSQVLDSLALHDGLWTASVPDDWMQGRSVFGGLQSALALRAMRAIVSSDLPLRVLQTTFAAPVAGRVAFRAQVLRSGKNVVYAEARIVDGESTCAIVVGVFGRARASKIEVAPAASPVLPPAEPFVPKFVPGLTPNFVRHFKFRWLSGERLFSGSRRPPRAVIEVDMTDDTPVSEPHVVAIADSIPPLGFSMLTEPAPGSSVTWTVEMLTDRLDGLALSGWRLFADVRAGRDGYLSQFATVYGPDGAAVALSQQTMVVFG